MNAVLVELMVVLAAVMLVLDTKLKFPPVIFTLDVDRETLAPVNDMLAEEIKVAPVTEVLDVMFNMPPPIATLAVTTDKLAPVYDTLEDDVKDDPVIVVLEVIFKDPPLTLTLAVLILTLAPVNEVLEDIARVALFTVDVLPEMVIECEVLAPMFVLPLIVIVDIFAIREEQLTTEFEVIFKELADILAA